MTFRTTRRHSVELGSYADCLDGPCISSLPDQVIVIKSSFALNFLLACRREGVREKALTLQGMTNGKTFARRSVELIATQNIRGFATDHYLRISVS